MQSPARTHFDVLQAHAFVGRSCKTCGALPDEYGVREHAQGCSALHEDGGGLDFDADDCARCRKSRADHVEASA